MSRGSGISVERFGLTVVAALSAVTAALTSLMLVGLALTGLGFAIDAGGLVVLTGDRPRREAMIAGETWVAALSAEIALLTAVVLFGLLLAARIPAAELVLIAITCTFQRLG
jgi:hypothetical protein